MFTNSNIQVSQTFTDFFNLVLVCKDIEPRYGRTRTRGFFSTVRVVYFQVYVIHKPFDTFIYGIFRVAIHSSHPLLPPCVIGRMGGMGGGA